MPPISSVSHTAAVTLRAATVCDIPAIARCWYHAFFDDAVIGVMMHPFRKEYPEDVYYFLLRAVRERYFERSHRFVVAIADGHVVGAVEWVRLSSRDTALDLSRCDPRNLISRAISLWNATSLRFHPNRAADPARSSYLDAAVDASRQYWTGDRAECWDLHVCGVHPAWQGQGVGRMLVTWGTAMADQEGLFCSVITGESKREFYKRTGFAEESKQLDGGGIILFRAPMV